MSPLEFNLLRDYCVVWIRLVEKAPGALVIKMTPHCWTWTNVYHNFVLFPLCRCCFCFQVFVCGTWSASWCACAPFPLPPTPSPWTCVTSKVFPSLTASSSQALSSTSWTCMWSTGTETRCTMTKVGNQQRVYNSRFCPLESDRERLVLSVAGFYSTTVHHLI